MTEKMNTTPELDTELDLELEDFFAAAREDASVPSANLLARISQDAAQVQDGFASTAVATPKPRVSWWRQILDDIGGMPAISGLAACACAGVYLGFVNPDISTGWTTASAEDAIEADGLMSHSLLGDVYWIEEG
ncbi:hypothetical protein [Tateyamaria sp.]|uniref:hypothetical protein n=1 Tax=Tateyamaria sp. TaxID=1929288 RepID=UPI00329AADAC